MFDIRHLLLAAFGKRHSIFVEIGGQFKLCFKYIMRVVTYSDRMSRFSLTLDMIYILLTIV